MKNDSQAK